MANPKDETLTITKAELQEMLRQQTETAVTAAVAAFAAAAPKPVGPTAEIVADIERAERTRAPQDIQLHPHRSPTGAIMRLRVVSSRTPSFPHGRIVGLEDYTYPKGWDVHVDAGGLSRTPVTVKASATERDPRPRLHPFFNQKVTWEQYWRADINAYVGKAYHPAMGNLTEAEFAEAAAKAAA